MKGNQELRSSREYRYDWSKKRQPADKSTGCLESLPPLGARSSLCVADRVAHLTLKAEVFFPLRCGTANTPTMGGFAGEVKDCLQQHAERPKNRVSRVDRVDSEFLLAVLHLGLEPCENRGVHLADAAL